MTERLARIQLIHLETERLNAEAQSCKDPQRITAIRREIEVLYQSAVEIRREQLMERINPTQTPTKKRWWRRGH